MSANYGVEGRSRKQRIVRIRERQMCNAVAVLFLAQGVPLLYEGDETGDSQNGNNNVYCQDNPTGWVNWKKDERYAWFREFVARMAAFRREHPVLAADMPKQLSDAKGTGYPDLSYHGENAWISDLSGERQSLGMLYCGKKDGDGTEGEEFLYVGCNFHMGPTRLALPKLPGKKKWYLLMDTARERAPFLKEEERVDAPRIELCGQSVVILTGK